MYLAACPLSYVTLERRHRLDRVAVEPRERARFVSARRSGSISFESHRERACGTQSTHESVERRCSDRRPDLGSAVVVARPSPSRTDMLLRPAHRLPLRLSRTALHAPACALRPLAAPRPASRRSSPSPTLIALRRLSTLPPRPPPSEPVAAPPAAPTVPQYPIPAWAERFPKALRWTHPYLSLARMDKPIGTWLLYWPCGASALSLSEQPLGPH